MLRLHFKCEWNVSGWNIGRTLWQSLKCSQHVNTGFHRPSPPVFGNIARKCQGNRKTRNILNVLEMFPKFPRILPNRYTGCGIYILNIPIRNISGTPFWFVLSFTDQEHCDCITGYIAKHTPNEPLGNTAGTFFGEIQDIPINYLIGTLRSHDLVHFECTSCFLWMSHLGKLQVLSLGKFRMFPSIT